MDCSLVHAGHFLPQGGDFSPRRNSMLWTIFVVLLVLWLLGMVTSYTLYGYIHLLLVIAAVVLLIRIIQGRRVL
jgi:hypothetical protein